MRWPRASLARPLQWPRPGRSQLAGLVVLLAAAVYANSLANGFAYDDVAVVRDDPRVHGLGQLAAIFSRPYWVDYGSQLGLYRPFTTLAFALEWIPAGGAPWLYHLVNLGLHAAVCVLLFLLLERLAGRSGALLGALVFAVHPVHTEAVANIVGQSELLAALGVLALALAWVRRPELAPSARALPALGAGYALAVFSKESALVAPALLVALDLAQRRVGPSRAGLRAYARAILPALAVFAAVAAAYLLARTAVLGSIQGGDVAPSIPFIVRDHFWMGLRSWQEYARLLVFPQDLSSDYSPAVILPVHGWSAATVFGAFLLGGVTLLALCTWVRPHLGLPAAWFVISILVVSNLFFPIGVVLAERTLYLPSVAVALALAFAWSPLRRRYPLPLLASAASILIVAFGLWTVARNPDWRDQDAVVAAMVRDHPESYRAQWNTAVRAFERGDTAGAERAWQLTYRLWPEDSHMLTEFGAYNVAIGRPHRALALLDEARAIHGGDPRTEELRAEALVAAGYPRDALAAASLLRGMLGAVPAVDEIRARAFIGLGEYDSAAIAWQRVVSAYPAGWVQWSGLGRSLARLGRFDAALAALDTAAARAAGDTVGLRQVRGFRELTMREAAAAGRR